MELEADFVLRLRSVLDSKRCAEAVGNPHIICSVYFHKIGHITIRLMKGNEPRGVVSSSCRGSCYRSDALSGSLFEWRIYRRLCVPRGILLCCAMAHEHSKHWYATCCLSKNFQPTVGVFFCPHFCASCFQFFRATRNVNFGSIFIILS